MVKVAVRRQGTLAVAGSTGIAYRMQLTNLLVPAIFITAGLEYSLPLYSENYFRIFVFFPL
jgi:hypothetical protein